MKKLLFIPLDYKYKPHLDWKEAFDKYFNTLYYSNFSDAIEFKPDYIFVQCGAMTVMDMMALKEITKAFVMQWTGDCREEVLDMVLMYKYCCDKTFLAVGLAQKEIYEKELNHQVHYLEHAAAPHQFRPVQESQENKKIVFVGNNYDQFEGGVERTKLCEELTKEFKTFEVWGNGYNLPQFRNPDSIKHNLVPDLYNDSYIGIACTNFLNKEGYHSNRPLEIMAAGSLCLLRYFPGIDRLFEDMRHCVYYDSIKDAKFQIEMLLRHPDLRNEIAKRGQEEVRKNHTYLSRVKEIKKALNI